MYAQVTATNGPLKAPLARKSQPQAVRAKTTRLNTRLFVKLALKYPARAASSFTILLSLKNSLKTHAYLLKEVLKVNLGFALYINLIESL